MYFALKSALALATFAALGLASAHSARATTYDFSNLDVPGGYATTAYGINNSGEVVGTYQDGSSGYHGFIYTAQTGYTTFNVPGAYAGSTQAFGVNNAGQIVGTYALLNGINENVYGFVDTPETGFTQFSDPAALATSLRGMNDTGESVGNFTDGTGEHGFISPDGTSFITLNGYLPNGINDSGQVVGSTNNAGFVFTPGSGFALLAEANAYGINDLGQIVGQDGSNGGYIYTPGAGYASFSVPASAVGDSYILDTGATGINDLDQVVGYYDDSTGRHSFLATPSPAPEPSQWAALGFASFGALGLIFRARKGDRNRSEAP